MSTPGMSKEKSFKEKDKDEGGVHLLEEIDISEESEPEEISEIQSSHKSEKDDEDQQDIENFESLINAVSKVSEIIRPNYFQKTEVEESRVEAKEVQRLEVVDDFLRNFLVKHKMTRTLEVFQVSSFE